MDIDVEPYLNLSSGMEFSNWKPEGWRVWEAGADLHCLGEDDLEQPHLGRVPRQTQDWGGRGWPGEHEVCRDDHGPHMPDLLRQVRETRSQRSPAVARRYETFPLWHLSKNIQAFKPAKRFQGFQPFPSRQTFGLPDRILLAVCRRFHGW